MSQQTFDIFQYLVVHAKFPSPEPLRSENSLGCSDVSEEEVAALDNDWKPITARFDNQMVDCLLSALGVYFKNNPVPAEITQEQLAVIFSSIVGITWDTNDNEAQVSDVFHQQQLANVATLYARRDIWFVLVMSMLYPS